MEELVKKIEELSAAFLKDAKAQVTNGNKAAGQRARKNSLEIEKLTKEFRKVSIEAAKKQFLTITFKNKPRIFTSSWFIYFSLIVI